jgi:hypothetical protein
MNTKHNLQVIALLRGGSGQPTSTENTNMLMTIAVVLLILYALGLVTSFTMGGLIHILLVTAVVTVLVSLIQGRRVT